jgi:glycosyltransferase involved in cell wall biosynthesis
MNICYVTPDVAVPYFRGASTHVYEVSKNLSARGHRVSVVSRRLNRSQPRWEIIDGFETYRTFQGLAFEPPTSSYSASHTDREALSTIQRLYSWYLRSYRAFQLGAEVATVMSGRGIDVVIERETAFGAGAVLSSMLRVPMVLEMVGPRVSSMSLRRATKVLAYSDVMVAGRVPKGKLEIVPAGVNTEMFSPDAAAGAGIREKHGIGDEFVVGYIGTFQLWHGVNTLLSAVKKLGSGDRKIRALMVGPYFAESMRYAEALGMATDAVFTGPVPYDLVPAYVNACDVLCAPYDPSLSKIRSERGIGAPLKVLEYMACEKPVVSTDVPPISDVVENGRTGVLVPPGDIDALANGIRGIMNDSVRANHMGREARKAVIDRYSWGDLARTLEKVLDAARANYLENRKAQR